MAEAGALVPTTFDVDFITLQRRGAQDLPDFPWLARKKHHIKGKDIQVVKSYQEAEAVRRARTHDFFSVWIPTKTEYRVWTFNRVIAIYEKQFKGEGEYEGYMRNRRFGFKFVKRDDLLDNRKLGSSCTKAVGAINMDFGAVDILESKDGHYYVLEVNSMPHIDSTERSSGIRLAKNISLWAEKQ
jgi:hypothetical protein